MRIIYIAHPKMGMIIIFARTVVQRNIVQCNIVQRTATAHHCGASIHSIPDIRPPYRAKKEFGPAP